MNTGGLKRTRLLLTACALLISMTSVICAKDTPKRPDCVYVPTPHDIVDEMLRMAEVKKDDVVYDLGCGDGRIVVQAARKRGCKGVGFEIVPELAEKARQNASQNKVSHLVEIREEDLFQVDFSDATVLPVYLLPTMLKRLKPKLAQLKAGTRIVSHDYPIEGVEPDEEVKLVSKETGAEHYLFLYKLPLTEREEQEEE
jgi:SAM-dependent methyltransferase